MGANQSSPEVAPKLDRSLVTTSSELAPSQQRMPSLDGLRGVAAFVVVLNHCMMLVPIVALAYDGSAHDYHGITWWVTFSPLHVYWAGSEAVAVFFVLSGFVLTRGADRLHFSWRAYYPSRLLRLYAPVAAAIALAWTTVEALPRKASSHSSWWLNSQTHVPTGLRNLTHDLLLVKGAETLLPVLWSLKWEVIFSLILPLAVYGAIRKSSFALVQAVCLIGVTLLGSDSTAAHWGGYWLYLPMFGIGALMARQHERLLIFGNALKGWSGSLVAVAGILLLTLAWTAHAQDRPAYQPAQTAGAALLVFTFGYWNRGRKAGESRLLQWLGRRSFSLYLVHFPIVLGVAFLLESHSRYAFVVAIPVSLLVADRFFRWAEAPSHRLAQSLKSRLKNEPRRTAATA